MKRTQSNKAADVVVDPIVALHDALIRAQEENWSAHGVSEQERVRLRPGVAAIARTATDRLRAEHAMRAGRP